MTLAERIAEAVMEASRKYRNEAETGLHLHEAIQSVLDAEAGVAWECEKCSAICRQEKESGICGPSTDFHTGEPIECSGTLIKCVRVE